MTMMELQREGHDVNQLVAATAPNVLSESIMELYIEDCERLLSLIPFHRRAPTLWDRITPDASVVLLLSLPEEERIASIATIEPQRRAEVLSALPLRSKRQLVPLAQAMEAELRELEELPSDERAKKIAKMDKEDALRIVCILRGRKDYGDGVLEAALPPEWTAAEGLELLELQESVKSFLSTPRPEVPDGIPNMPMDWHICDTAENSKSKGYTMVIPTQRLVDSMRGPASELHTAQLELSPRGKKLLECRRAAAL